MRKLVTYLLLINCGIFSFGCQKEDNKLIDDGDLEIFSQTIPVDGTTLVDWCVFYATDYWSAEINYTPSDSEEWIILDRLSGPPAINTNLIVTCAPNNSDEERTATITIVNGTFILKYILTQPANNSANQEDQSQSQSQSQSLLPKKILSIKATESGKWSQDLSIEYSYEYDENGRIIHIQYHDITYASVRNYDIVYEGNTITSTTEDRYIATKTNVNKLTLEKGLPASNEYYDEPFHPAFPPSVMKYTYGDNGFLRQVDEYGSYVLSGSTTVSIDNETMIMKHTTNNDKEIKDVYTLSDYENNLNVDLYDLLFFQDFSSMAMVPVLPFCDNGYDYPYIYNSILGKRLKLPSSIIFNGYYTRSFEYTKDADGYITEILAVEDEADQDWYTADTTTSIITYIITYEP